MKVLFITHYSTLYGANLSMLGLVENLRNRYEVDIIVLANCYGELIDTLSEKGIKYVVTPYYSWEEKIKKGVVAKLKIKAKQILNFFYFRCAYKKLKNDKFDIVHSNSSVIHIGDFLSRKFFVPHIWHLREFGKADYDLDYTYPMKQVAECYERATYCIVISEDMLAYYKKKFPRCRFIKIYNGIIPSPKIDRHGTQNKIEFCCVGLICEGKRQIDIIYAASRLLEKGKNKFHINFIGTGEISYIDYLKEIVNKSRLDEYISFLGHQNNVPELLEAMNIGIMASKREAFGRVTVEYMFASMPVIGTNSLFHRLNTTCIPFF